LVLFLLAGTFVYNKIIPLPCLRTEEDKELRQIQEAERDGMEEALLANKDTNSGRSHIDEEN